MATTDISTLDPKYPAAITTVFFFLAVVTTVFATIGNPTADATLAVATTVAVITHVLIRYKLIPSGRLRLVVELLHWPAIAVAAGTVLISLLAGVPFTVSVESWPAKLFGVALLALLALLVIHRVLAAYLWALNAVQHRLQARIDAAIEAADIEG